jgi:ADP-ribosylglycohydrolase
MEQTVLYKKILGSYAGSSIGAAMGAAVEWICNPHGGYKAIEEKYGWVEELLPWTQKERSVRYWNSPKLQYYHMDCLAGMTEDGTELKHLAAQTIINKKGRINVHDLADMWRAKINRDHIGYLINPHIVIYYDRLMAGDDMTRIPPGDIGTGSYWPGMVDVQMMISPIGIINAGDPEQAALDVFNVGSIMQSRIGFGLDLGAAISASVAEAFNPNATVDSVIEASKRYVAKPVQEIIDEAIEIAICNPDLKSVRQPFFDKYSWLPAFDGMEVLAEALACFYVAKGDVRKAVIGGTNFGRDTDCIACVAGAIAGAFSGSDALPEEWIDTVDHAVANHPYTVQDKPLREMASGLYEAVISNQNRIENQLNVLKELNR